MMYIFWVFWDKDRFNYTIFVLSRPFNKTRKSIYYESKSGYWLFYFDKSKWVSWEDPVSYTHLDVYKRQDEVWLWGFVCCKENLRAGYQHFIGKCSRYDRCWTEIADKLCISIHTVHIHRQNLLRKLGVDVYKRQELFLWW